MDKTIKILLVEDNLIKAQAILDELKKLGFVNITTRDSFRNGLKFIIGEQFDLLLLDMSLPTWDLSEDRSSDSFERFGGWDIMKEMKRKKVKIPTIVITMFSDFGIGKSLIKLEQLHDIFTNDFKDFYLGIVKYSSSESTWHDELKTLIHH